MESSDGHLDVEVEGKGVAVALSEPSASSDIIAGEEYQSKSNDYEKSSESDIEAVAKGLSSLLSAVIRDFDARAQATLGSQDQFLFNLDRLTGELDQLLEDAPLPFIMQHTAKICGVRKRVLSLNSLLSSIQRRVDNIDILLTAILRREKMKNESSGPSG